MITLSVARMLVSAVEPARTAPVENVVEVEPQPRGFARLMPAALRRLVADRRAQREARRLDALAVALAVSHPVEPVEQAEPAPRLLLASPRRPARVTLGTGASATPV